MKYWFWPFMGAKITGAGKATQDLIRPIIAISAARKPR